jgi:hypothetical protein
MTRAGGVRCGVMLDGLMVADLSVEIDGRVLRHCLYGPADGFPVIAHVLARARSQIIGQRETTTQPDPQAR